jgi:hypothetical protein
MCRNRNSGIGAARFGQLSHIGCDIASPFFEESKDAVHDGMAGGSSRNSDAWSEKAKRNSSDRSPRPIGQR